MASSILQPLRLSDNDVTDLSIILSNEINIYRENPQAVFSDDYCTWLNLVAGLGYTVVLCDKYDRYQAEYSKCFNSYLKARRSYPKAFSVADVEAVSQSIARMVQLALQAVPYSLSLPRYFDDFAEALKQLVCRAILHDTSNSSFKEKAFRIVDLINHLT